MFIGSKKFLNCNSNNLSIFYTYIWLCLINKKRIVLLPNCFFINEKHLVYFDRMLVYYSQYNLNLKSGRLNCIFTVFFICSNFNVFTVWRNFNLRVNCYSVDSSLPIIANYGLYNNLILIDYLNKLNEEKIFWEVWDKKIPNPILAVERKRKIKRRFQKFLKTEEVNKENYYFSEKYRDDKIHFYNHQVAWRPDLWKMVTMVSTIAFAGKKIQIMRYAALSVEIENINFYLTSTNEHVHMVFYLSSRWIWSPVYDRHRGFPIMMGLVNKYWGTGFFDYTVAVDRETISGSYVFLMMIFEHYAVAQKMRFNVLKSSYYILRMQIEIKKKIISLHILFKVLKKNLNLLYIYYNGLEDWLNIFYFTRFFRHLYLDIIFYFLSFFIFVLILLCYYHCQLFYIMHFH